VRIDFVKFTRNNAAVVMEKAQMKTVARLLIFLLIFGAACASLSVPGSSALAVSLDSPRSPCATMNWALGRMECTSPKLICSFGLIPGLTAPSSVPSYCLTDFWKQSQSLAAIEHCSGAPGEAWSIRSRLSGYQISPKQRFSIHLLNSVLTL